MKRNRFYLCLLCVLFSVTACIRKTELEYTLEQAGAKRMELEKVLSHYKNNPLKKQAAEYLISNLIGNFAYDTTFLYKYRTVLLRYDSLKKVEDKLNIDAKYVLNEDWKKFIRHNNFRQEVYSRTVPDLKSISADYLINNIELAFQSREQNLCKDSILFDDFLRYVLPYRRNNKYIVEPWRDYFLTNYGEYMSRFQSPRELVDSLMEQCNDYQVNGATISTYPYLCLRDYNLAKISNCSQRCWFNSMLLSALGIPCTIDFVPAWGNRNSSHEWNAIIVNGKTYPFEATGGRSKWKSGKVYNNVWVDEYWMKSRLPKVFRYSYETVWKGPAMSGQGNKNDIPALFLSPKYADVSDEYFITSDICIPIKRGIDGTGMEYAYLCVFNEDTWKPVAWGKVGCFGASFEKMGRDIVYLPVFFKNGHLIPINDAFILKEDGNIHFLRADEHKMETVKLERKYYARPDIDFWCKWNEGARFEVSSTRSFNEVRTIFTVPECKSRPNIWHLDTPVKCRYIRYIFPEDKDVLAELSFYQNGVADSLLQPLKGTLFSSDKERVETLQRVVDGDILTFADMNPYVTKEDSLCWVGMDFGKEVEIAAVGLCPRNDKNNVIKGMEYELFYWANAWVSLGRKLALDYSLKYDNVPSNALLLLKCTTEGRENRIFTWEDEGQKWW